MIDVQCEGINNDQTGESFTVLNRTNEWQWIACGSNNKPIHTQIPVMFNDYKKPKGYNEY